MNVVIRQNRSVASKAISYQFSSETSRKTQVEELKKSIKIYDKRKTAKCRLDVVICQEEGMT